MVAFCAMQVAISPSSASLKPSDTATVTVLVRDAFHNLVTCPKPASIAPPRKLTPGIERSAATKERKTPQNNLMFGPMPLEGTHSKTCPRIPGRRSRTYPNKQIGFLMEECLSNQLRKSLAAPFLMDCGAPSCTAKNGVCAVSVNLRNVGSVRDNSSICRTNDPTAGDCRRPRGI